MFVDDVRILDECIRYIRSENTDRQNFLRQDKNESDLLLKYLDMSPGTSEPAISRVPSATISITTDKPSTTKPEEIPDDLIIEEEEREHKYNILYSKKGALSFSRVPILPVELNQSNSSGLSIALSNMSQSNASISSTSGDALTIYLPNGDFISLIVKASLKVLDIIKKIMSVYRDSKLSPPLYYDNPTLYQLHIHDTDGEPDEDFPPLDASLPLSHYLLFYGDECKEYVLCRSSMSELVEPPKPLTEPVLARTISSDRHDEAGLSVTVELAGGSGGGSPFRWKKVSDGAKVKDMLPQIAKQSRLSLYTDQYVFTVGEEDQQRLMLTSPVVDMNWLLCKLGVREYMLQKKAFADVPQPVVAVVAPELKPTIPELFKQSLHDAAKAKAEELSLYQEWPIFVLQKTALTRPRRMDLILIVNRAAVSVFKSELKRGAAGPQRVAILQKATSLVAKIELVGTDGKSFRILWKDVNTGEIPTYMCNTTRDCNEIVEKVKGIIELLSSPML